MGIRRTLQVSMAVLMAASIAAGCGDDGGGGGGSDEKAAKDAPKLAAADENPSGEIALCIGKDTSGIHTKLVEQFNKEHPDADAKLVELPESADEQRNQMVQRLRAKSKECDLLALDVVWTAEFAAQGWLADASELVDERRDEFIEATLETIEYDGRHWGVPYNSNAAFLFYRSDQVKEVPDTWNALYDEAAKGDGLVYQGARYEGLTVHFLELLYSNGGEVLNEDGTESVVDSEEAREVLQLMVDGIESGAVPKAVGTYKEEEARRAFEAGNATYMRQWPYAYTLGQEAGIKGKFDIATLPGFEGGEPASILGGYNLAVSAYTDNPGGSAALIDYLTSMEAQVEAGKVATPPVLADAYDDPAVQKAMPFAEQLRDAIDQGRSRPASPVYPQISEAIYKNVHAALTGTVEVDEAITKMDADIGKALETF